MAVADILKKQDDLLMNLCTLRRDNQQLKIRFIYIVKVYSFKKVKVKKVKVNFI